MLLEHQNKTQVPIFSLLPDPIPSSNQNKRNREEESSLIFLVWKTHGWDSSLNLRSNHGKLQGRTIAILDNYWHYFENCSLTSQLGFLQS